MDSDFGQRAKERRMRLVGGTARSFAELDEAGANYWSQASHAERLRATHEAIAEAWVLQGNDGPPPGFDGSTWGVLQFER